MKFIFALCCFTVSVFGQSYVWELKQTGSSLGNPIITDAKDKKVVYYGSNSQIYKSTNSGESFVNYGVAIPNATKIKNMIMHRKDPQIMLVAIKGSSSDQILKTTNGGQSWVVSANGLSFSYFGIPMTPDPSHPDTIYTMSGNNFMVSPDFGSNWRTVSSPSNFGSPCDIEVFPDSSNIILVGDNTTGIFRSSDYGRTWQTKFVTSGEIPTIAIARQKGSVCFATRWGGGGGVLRSTDYGNTWTPINYFNNQNMWGVDVAADNPNFVLTGKYSGNTIYISRDGGINWTPTYINGSNYSIFYVNQDNIFAAQSTGFYKLKDIKGGRAKIYNVQTGDADAYNTVSWKISKPDEVVSCTLFAGKDDAHLVPFKVFAQSANSTEFTSGVFTVQLHTDQNPLVKVQIVCKDGSSDESGILQLKVPHIKNAMNARAYPNPFNPSTKISFHAITSGTAYLQLYSALGELVMKQELYISESGEQSFDVNLVNKPSGVYYYQISSQSLDGRHLMENGKILLQK